MAKVNSQDFSSYHIYDDVGTFGNVRVISTNGIPDHPIGIFPIYEAMGGKGCGRPNALGVPKAATYIYLPVTPAGAVTWDVLPNTFGIALNGVPLDPLANERWSGATSASGDPSDPNAWYMNGPLHPDMATDLDDNMAHIQPAPLGATGGTYHYHALPTGLYEGHGGSYPWNFSGTAPAVTNVTPIQLGWGWDGVPVYGPTCYQAPPAPGAANWYPPKSDWTLKSGCRAPTGPPGNYNGDYHYDYKTIYTTGGLPPFPLGYVDLDECNGHTAAVSANGTAFYHYHITEEYPYIPRCWKYTPYYGAGQATLEKEARGAGFSPTPTPTPTPSPAPRLTPTPRPGPIS